MAGWDILFLRPAPASVFCRPQALKPAAVGKRQKIWGTCLKNFLGPFEKKLAKKAFICYYTTCTGHWRSWERATLAVWRSRVRIPYAPFYFS